MVLDSLGTGDQAHMGPELRATQLDDRIALLAERVRDRPVAGHRDVHQRDPNTKILHIRDDVREVLLGAYDSRVADGMVAGQGGQVAVDLTIDAFTPARAHAAEPELNAG